MKEKPEYGRCTCSCTDVACTGSETTQHTDPHVRRMLHIAAACVRLARRSISTDDSIALAREALLHLECEIALAVERRRHAQTQTK